MPPGPSGAGAPSSPPAVNPRLISSADYKKLIRLIVPKIKLGSELSTVKKQCISLVKSHKLNVSGDECFRIASAVCSGDPPRRMTDIFPDDCVRQVKNNLITELPKVPAVQYIDANVFASKFMSSQSVPSRFCSIFLK